MPSPLTEKEVNRLFHLLDINQMNFLQSYLKQSKKSKWLEKLAHKKGIVLHSSDFLDEIWEKLNDWELKEILDGGYGNRPYKCECGITLRYCYIVHHREENKTYQLGETCLGNYTMMSAELIKDITSGFHKIDLERDEILIRYEQGWELPIDYNGLILTEDLKTQLDIGLPISSIQENKIEKMFHQELLQIRRQKELAKMTQLRMRQLTFSEHSNVSSFPNSRSDYITYDELLSKHLSSLKQIREHENRITYPIMLEKWNNLQNMTKSLKRGENFNYSSFLSQMFELLYYLKLY